MNKIPSVVKHDHRGIISRLGDNVICPMNKSCCLRNPRQRQHSRGKNKRIFRQRNRSATHGNLFRHSFVVCKISLKRGGKRVSRYFKILMDRKVLSRPQKVRPRNLTNWRSAFSWRNIVLSLRKKFCWLI